VNEQRSSHKPSMGFPSPNEPALSVMAGLARALPTSREPLASLAWLVLALTLATGCAEEPGVCDSVDGEACDQCSDGEFTCTYDGVSVTTDACQGCQTRLALFDELCALGRTDSRAEVDASMVCDPADSGAR